MATNQSVDLRSLVHVTGSRRRGSVIDGTLKPLLESKSSLSLTASCVDDHVPQCVLVFLVLRQFVQRL